MNCRIFANLAIWAFALGANLLPDVGDSGFQACIPGGRCLLDLRGDAASAVSAVSSAPLLRGRCSLRWRWSRVWRWRLVAWFHPRSRFLAGRVVSVAARIVCQRWYLCAGRLRDGLFDALLHCLAGIVDYLPCADVMEHQVPGDASCVEVTLDLLPGRAVLVGFSTDCDRSYRCFVPPGPDRYLRVAVILRCSYGLFYQPLGVDPVLEI